MSDLSEWLESQNSCRQETVQIDGKEFLVKELSLATIDEIAQATAASDKDGVEFQARIMCHAICDPETGLPVKPDDWQFWGSLGTKFLPLRLRVIELNRLSANVEAAVKK